MDVETVIRSAVEKGIDLIARFNRSRLKAPPGGHPFLNGVHAPMLEEKTLTDLKVTGHIPPELDGRYLRIGPNPIEPNAGAYHWFTGDGMVHGISIKGGKAHWYRNRWIRSERVAEARGLQAAPGPRHEFDTVNTNVVNFGDRTFALVEAGSYPVELGLTLDEQTYNPFDGTLKGSFTAHPHLDPRTGDSHAICYEGKDLKTIRHVVVNQSGKVTREEPIEVNHGPLVHDCAITDRYVIILDLPVTFSMAAVLKGYELPYRWNPKHPARVGLLPREGKSADVIWCEVPSGYAFHVANAYDDEEGRVVLDLCPYDTMFRSETTGPDGRSRGLERWTIDSSKRAVEIKTLDGAPQDFPRIDERFFGKRHRYIYSLATATRPDAIFSGSTMLFAHDLESQQRLVHDFGRNRFPGEFVFVNRHPGSAEGDGWLIGFVIDMSQQTTDLVILDTKRFTESPVATVHIPHRIPAGFHGNWLKT